MKAEGRAHRLQVAQRGLFPLSNSQTEIWLGQKLSPDSPCYNIGRCVEIFGTIDPNLFEVALRQTIHDVDSLRLRFVETAFGPRQFFSPTADESLQFYDLSETDNPRAAAETWMRQDLARVFAMASGALFRSALFKVADGHFLWYGVNHHLINDAFGASLIERIVADHYSALAQVGRRKPARAPSWLEMLDEEESYRRSDRYDRDRIFWRGRLEDRPEPSTLSGRPPNWTGQTIRTGGCVAGSIIDALKAAVGGRHISLAAILAAATAAYLTRTTGMGDVILGMPVTARPSPTLRRIVGLASNVVPFRLQVDLAASFQDLLEQAGRELRQALRHQRYWTGAMRKDLGLTPDQPDFYGTIINFIPIDEELDFAGAPVRKHNLFNLRVGDLSITVLAGSKTRDIAVELTANETHYDAATLSGHLRGFLRLIEALAAAPGLPIGHLTMPASEDRARVMGFASPLFAPTRTTLPALFEAQVSRTPDGVAAIQGGRSLSYGELNRRANRLARDLVRRGVGPEVLVGLGVERSPEMLVGLLAILKAGGAYLPLDPALPPARLAWMVEDARPALLLASAATAPFLPADVPRLMLDAAVAADRPQDDGDLADRDRLGALSTDHAAYVIYTSGSTGRPKGVVVTHTGIAALASSHLERLGLTKASRVLQFASLSFDASMAELVTAWASGAALVLIPPDALGGPALREVLVRQRVTHATLPPAVLATISPGADLALECLAVAGEACPDTLVAAWSNGQRLLNIYGPTESTVCATISGPLDGMSAPIGRPIEGTQVYVLDAALEPVAVGVAGELYIAGAGLARGYLNQPGFTAERFLACPFGPPGARMYRTGDRARWRADGTLDYLGRIDQQVKIRGFRVEAGEIEAAIASHPGIAQALVLARDDDLGGPSLVAYLRAADGATPEPAALRRALADRLPGYMIPAAFVTLEAFPLTPNGKIDRRALPVPGHGTRDTASYVMPEGPFEAAVAALWVELLGVERVGRHDNFFALGGHSLLAIKMVELLRQRGWQAEVRLVFTHPTPAGLAAALNGAGPTTAAIPPNRIAAGCVRITPDLLPLVALSQTAIDAIVATVPGGSRNVQDIYPLAPLQEGLLFHRLLSTDRDVYLTPAMLAFDNRTHLDRFCAALQSVIDRHDILRTAFLWEGLPQPVQTIWRTATLPVEEIAIAGGEDDLWSQAMRRHARIDIREAPLMRALVAEDAVRQRWLMVLRFHHLIVDHTTLEMIVAEVRAYCAGTAESLPEPVPFRRFVAAALGASPDEHAAFFRETLGDVDEPTAPFGLLDIQADGSGIGEARQVLDAGLARRLRIQARRLGVTPASVFHLAWALVLARVAGRHDLVFGTVLFGRMQGGAGVERALGLFINTLPLRVTLTDIPAEQAVRVVHARLARLMSHEHATLSLAQQCSAVPPPTPLFTALLNYRYSEGGISSSALARPLWDGASLLRVEERSNYPFALFVDDTGTGFELDLQVPNEIGPGRIGAFVHIALERLVTALDEAPGTSVLSLAILPAEERHLVVEAWNATASPTPATTIPALFEARAARTPNATALLCGEAILSYAALDARASRLARSLVEQGVGAHSVVGLVLPRSIDMVVALLGVLKAGAAYLPLDPDYPSKRLAFMIRDSRALRLIVTVQTLANLAGIGAALPPVLVLDDFERLGHAETEPFDINASAPAPNSVAYVIYTSGSTGTPKCVANTHAGLVNRLVWQWQTMPYHEGDVACAKTSINFVDSVTEILAPLLQGVPLIIATGEQGHDPARLAVLVAEHKVTRLTLVPSLLGVLLDTPDRLVSLRLCVSSGEPLPRSLVNRFCGLLPQASLWNYYGASETNGDSLAALVEAGEQPVTIGRPINNTQVYVLDAALEPVAVGVAGELYIAGAGLARGYLNQPGFTAERFLACPFGPPGARMYRTGDRARWLADGTLDYLGRIDQQVKIRGFRVEPGEIEAAIASHPGIAQALVLAREDDLGGPSLVAYLRAADGATPEPAALRRALADRLPGYMIPAAFVTLEAFPLTPNGKIDRRALPAPDDKAYARTSNDPPGTLLTPTEDELAAIWGEILHIGAAGRHDDFFDLGGHSLSALQVVARVRDKFSVELPLKTVFEARTLSALSGQIDQALLDRRHAPRMPPIERAPHNGPVRLSYSQERMWLIQSLDPANTAYNLVVALRIKGDLDVEALSAALGELTQRHEILRTTIRLVDGQPMPVVGGTATALHVVELRQRGEDAAAEAARLAQAQARLPFDLARGPVIRTVLYRIGPGDDMLVLVAHHIAGDQWSIGVLGRELAELYNGKRRKDPARLAPLPVAYRDYARWQREVGQQLEFVRQLAFWRQQLADLPPVDLPTDRPRSHLPTLNGAFCAVPIPAALLHVIEQLGRNAGSTTFMTMLAAFATLLHRISGQSDIAIGVPVANRTQSITEGLVGTLVNTLVLRIDLSGDPPFEEVLRRVRATSLNAFAHQDIPFDALVQELRQHREMSRAPLAQVLFNVTNAPMHGITFDGLTWEAMTLDRGGAQFELSLSVDLQTTRTVTVEYNTDLFDRSTVERRVGQYFRILEAASASPATRIGALALLPDAEHAVLRGWNATATPYPQDKIFVQIFEQQVARCPDAPAVSFEDTTLTYAELDAHANQVAQRLRALGVGPGAVVALCVARSPTMLAALLGIQKSGGAYLPLDPDYPGQRLAFMLADSRATVLVTAGNSAAGIDCPAGVVRLDLDSKPQAGPADTSAVPATPADVAYIIYTSGSTGRPKGVVVPHGALLNFLWSMRQSPGLNSADVMAAVTTISFDIAALELYLPLTTGGRIELVSRETAADGPALARRLEASGASVLQATPATWRMLIEAGWTGGQGFRALCGGERLADDLAASLLPRVGELWNLYGPTETTVWSTVERVTHEGGQIGIGRPIANTRVDILDPAGELVPIGIEGEICIGGAGVARGYLGRPGLTAERFVPDPRADVPGQRMYRTGDLGRWTAEGRLHCLGRLDHQVKIRGFRIEPGEIEAAMRDHSGVQQVVVMARRAASGDERLVAYLVFRPGADLTASEMRRHLRLQLPEFMVPSAIVALTSVPLTPNGKIDRDALPDPFRAALRATVIDDPPAPGLERQMAEIWQSVLAVERISASDNFFELGGHSLLSLRVVAAVERLGYRMDPRTLFFHTLREVVALLPSNTQPDAAHAR